MTLRWWVFDGTRPTLCERGSGTGFNLLTPLGRGTSRRNTTHENKGRFLSPLSFLLVDGCRDPKGGESERSHRFGLSSSLFSGVGGAEVQRKRTVGRYTLPRVPHCPVPLLINTGGWRGGGRSRLNLEFGDGKSPTPSGRQAAAQIPSSNFGTET